MTIPLAFSVGFVAAIAPQLSSGPFWSAYVRDYTTGCAKNGYLSVLYMNIYQDIFGVEGGVVSFIYYILIVIQGYFIKLKLRYMFYSSSILDIKTQYVLVPWANMVPRY